jgi:hypothetical protein
MLTLTVRFIPLCATHSLITAPTGHRRSHYKERLKVVDWKNTFINRYKIWKLNAKTDIAERLALCAKWGALELLKSILKGYDRENGKEGREKSVLHRKSKTGGKTIFHWACEFGNLEIIEYLLLKYGPTIDVNLSAEISGFVVWNARRVKHFPLSLASLNGHWNVIQFLLENEKDRYAIPLHCFVADSFLLI